MPPTVQNTEGTCHSLPNEPKSSLAAALLEHETLGEEEAYAAAGVAHEDAEPKTPLRAAAFGRRSTP